MTTIVVRVAKPPDDPDSRTTVEYLLDDGDTGAPHTLSTGLILSPLPPPPPGVPGDDALTAIRTLLVESDTGGTDLLLDCGTYLADILHLGEAWEAWKAAINQGDVQPLRVLFDVQDAEFSGVPWELLTVVTERLFLGQTVLPARGRFPLGAPLEPHSGPLKVLLVVGTGDDPTLAADDEVSSVHGAVASAAPDTLGLVHAEVLYSPTREVLLSEVKALRPHILHVIAHGDRDPGVGAVIRFRDGGEDPWALSIGDIVGLLPWAPPVVVLNSCHTHDADVQHELSTLASAFHDRGSKAVVAMQGAIGTEAAVAFAKALYLALGAGKPVDEAVAEGRRGIAISTGLDRRDWVLPVLTVTAAPAPVVAPSDARPLGQVAQFEQVRAFVDRGYERRSVWWGVDPDDDAPRNLLIVTGEDGVGKTSLVHSCLLTSFRRGRRVRYVSFASGRNLTWLEAVHLVANGADYDGASILERALPEPMRSRFNHDFNLLKRGLATAPLPPGTVVAATDEPFEATDGHIELIFASFRDALARTADGQPFILAVDDLGGVLKEDLAEYVWPWLFRPIADGSIEGVRAVVIAGDNDFPLVPEDMRLTTAQIPVQRFPASELIRLSREYCARKAITYDEVWSEIAAAAAIREVHWKPSYLRTLEDAATGSG